MTSEGPQEDVYNHIEQGGVSSNQQCVDDVVLSNASKFCDLTALFNVASISVYFALGI